ncbi:hypothetical protein K469DRAFT_397417 [Zopfia rhizophila CBS 207.26]|uniref:Zn(2)-C6 fungal-type domain-containing protein n=1 Tax=Zopfia rhizophila CBS 207.26 TaxID=1314779 RepID=A0A6A6DEH4_9PEZI|nr:hypothetical protein K469DRAFT_397417 [Zopfia rhizophila CBS 207.26]
METKRSWRATPNEEQFPSSTPEIVLSWLIHVDVGAAPMSGALWPESPATTTEQEQGYFDKPPRTPERARELSPEEGRPSPTNANFSDQGIFDKPLHDSSRLGSSNDNGNIFSVSSATSASDDESFCNQRLEKPNGQSAKDKGSLNSYDPPTEINVTPSTQDLLIGDRPVNHLNWEQPRLVWITSCLQCTLAQLPCSRTLPACSRCMRAGCGNQCLMHRRKLNEERIPGDVVRNMVPVLLKVKGDDVEVWERKMALCDELLQTWQFDLDRNNWVLPINNRQKGSYLTHGNKAHTLQLHPGEGFGRNTWQVVHLA